MKIMKIMKHILLISLLFIIEFGLTYGKIKAPYGDLIRGVILHNYPNTVGYNK